MPLTLGDPTQILAPPPMSAPPPTPTVTTPPATGAAPPPATGTVAPPPPAPTTVKIGATNPDYGALITSDPNYVAGMGDITAAQTRDAASRDANIRRALIQGGFDITDPSFDPSVLDPATRQAIKDNQFSTAAQLAKNRLHGLSDLSANLAARGIIQSGALTGGSQRIQDNYAQATHDAISQLLNAISGYTTNYANSQDARSASIAGLREAAAQRIAADPRYQANPGQDAVLDPSTGFYKTPDGRWYTVDGRPVSDPSGNIGPTADLSGSPTAGPYSWGIGGKQ